MEYHDPTNYRYREDTAVALCHFLLPQDPSLATEVSVAITRPDAYLSQFGGRLAERGTFEPIPTLPWIALLDGLIARGRLVEVDWRDGPENVMHYIGRLLPPPLLRDDRWTWVDTTIWEEAVTEDFVKAIGARLGEQGVVLGCFQCAWFPSDAYALMVVDDERFPTARRLAQEFGESDLVPCVPGALL
jgi:hypothetical protein